MSDILIIDGHLIHDVHCVNCGVRFYPPDVMQEREDHIKQYEINCKLTRGGMLRVRDQLGVR